MSTWNDGVYYPLGRGDGDMSEGEYQSQYEVGSTTDASLSEKRGFWRTRNGIVLTIAEMSGPHLKNAVCYFERTGWSNHPKIVELREELARRSR